jgi:hypothetical protein
MGTADRGSPPGELNRTTRTAHLLAHIGGDFVTLLMH